MDVSERAIRNWLEGKNGPNGESLVRLMRHSDAVFDVVLELSNRSSVGKRVDLSGVRAKLLAIAEMLDASHLPG